MLFSNKTTEDASQLDAGPITDDKILKKERIKFGIGTLLFQSEEFGLGGIPTKIIRELGGNLTHIGIFGAQAGIVSLFQWVGTGLLKYFNSNRKAMLALTAMGLACSVLLVLSILGSYLQWFKPFSLYLYLILALVLAAITGIQWNLESNWIGDLVPKNRLGSFTSVKWIMSVIGAAGFSFVLGRICDAHPNPKGYVAIYAFFIVTFAVAMQVYATITDRRPKNANFVSDGPDHHQRLQYGSRALICYTLFYSIWTGGRTIFYTFNSAYLMDEFNFSMVNLAWLLALQYTVSVLVIFTIGKLADKSKSGHRNILIFICFMLASAMSLWFLSAWFRATLFGLPIIILIFQIINGAGGMTHSMLATNYAIEIFPAKGRSGYIAFSQIVIGIVAVIMPIVAGFMLARFSNFHYQLLGASLNKYHLMFLFVTLFTLTCTIPLLIAGKRKVE